MVRTMNGLNSKKKMKRTHEKAPPPPDTGAPPPDTGAPPPAYTGAPQPAENSAPPPADTGAPPPADTGAPPPSVILHPSPVDTASVRPTEISFPSAEIEEDDEATSLERSPPLRPHDNDEDTEDTQPLQPEKFYFRQTDYTEYCKLSSMSEENKTMKELEEILGEDEKNWFRTHSQFKHIWHIHREDNHMYTHMWILLMLTVYMGKDRVCWFVVNGVPVRYSLRKHGLLCGLDCRIYPANHEKLGSKDFVNQCFKKEKEANSGHNQRSEREATFHGRMWRADKDGDPLVLKHSVIAPKKKYEENKETFSVPKDSV